MTRQLNRCTGRSSRYKIDYWELQNVSAYHHRGQKRETKRFMRRLNRRLSRVIETQKD